MKTNEALKSNPGKFFGDRVVHGDQDFMQRLQALQLWSSIFTGIGLIANRITPPHRDQNGHAPFYDLLLSAGTHTHARFKVIDFDASFLYKPGTVIALCGAVFRHALLDFKGKDRLCLAHFMRYNMVDRVAAGAKEASWVEADIWLSSFQEKFKEATIGFYTHDGSDI